MKLTIQLQVLPDAEQRAVLLTTMERFNQAATFAAKVGFEAGVFSQPSIHKLCYQEIRARFGLSAQMAVRAIGKAVECFKRDKTVCPVFKPHGAITYDQRILGFKGVDRVSLWTMTGRMVLALAYGAYQGERFDRIKGQCDLVYRDGKFFLYATVNMPEGSPVEVKDFLGIDMGVVNLATDSDGENYSGAEVDKVREKTKKHRADLNKKGTKSARRRLRKIRKRESNFRKNVNHCIAKKRLPLGQGKDTRGFGNRWCRRPRGDY